MISFLFSEFRIPTSEFTILSCVSLILAVLTVAAE